MQAEILLSLYPEDAEEILSVGLPNLSSAVALRDACNELMDMAESEGFNDSLQIQFLVCDDLYDWCLGVCKDEKDTSGVFEHITNEVFRKSSWSEC